MIKMGQNAAGKSTKRVSPILLLLVCGFVFFEGGRLNALHTWTGQVSNQWNHPSNWSPANVPTQQDDVLIPATVSGTIQINGANASCKSLTYQGAGMEIYLNPGWNLIIAGDLTITGNSKITGAGSIELTGNNPIHFHHSDSTVINIQGIDVKTGSDVYLENNLNMTYGYLNLYEGNFKLNGYSATFMNVYIMDGVLSRTLDITGSELTVTRLYLFLNNGAGFLAQNSVVNAGVSVSVYGNAYFNVLNAANGLLVNEVGTNVHTTIKTLNASGDIFIKAAKGYYNQGYSIQNLNVLNSPAMVSLTPSPYTSAYSVGNITIPPACNGQVLFTDEEEVNSSRVNLYMTFPDQLNEAAFANISVNQGGLTVYNGTNLGNNSGISFQQTNSQTYYWINGQGKWNDPNHWSYTSGGQPSGCIPKLHDVVVMDNLSGFQAGDTVLIEKHAFCRDLMTQYNTSAKPFITNKTSTGQILHIAGSINLEGISQMDFSNYTYFWGNGTHHIRMAGNKFMNSIFFFTPGTWNLTDDLNLRDGTRALNHLNGTIITNSHELTIGNLSSQCYSLPHSVRKLDIGNSVIHIGNAHSVSGSVAMLSDSLTVTTGSSEFIFEYLDDDAPSFTISGSNHLEFYNVTFKNKVSTPVLKFNLHSKFNKVHFMGNGQALGLTYLNGQDNSQIDTLQLTTSFRYELEAGRILQINNAIITDTNACNQLALVTSTSYLSQTILFHTGGNLNTHHLMIDNMNFDGNGAYMNIVKGYDAGNNTNLNFMNTVPSHVYYWNGEGNTPDWSEARNWNIDILPVNGNNNDLAATVNPLGCVPSFLDSVVFTLNSFPVKDSVRINQNCNYKGMQWMTGSATGKTLCGATVYSNNNYGSLQFDSGLSLTYTGPTYFRGSGAAGIRSAGICFAGSVYFKCFGNYHLLDGFTVYGNNTIIYSGGFYTHGYPLTSKNLSIAHQFAPATGNNVLSFDTTHIRIMGAFSNYFYQGKTVLNASGTYTEFTGSNASFSFAGDLPGTQWGNVDYQGNGTAVLNCSAFATSVGFKTMEFKGDGIMTGNTTSDTLIYAEGREYKLGSGFTQYINHALISKGSPCYRTTITSTTPGQRAYIQHPSCNITIEHARVRDIEGVSTGCSALQYTVNVGGEDMGNNQGWTFVPGNPIEGLGPDTTLNCDHFPYLLSSAGFGSYTSITWNNSSNHQPDYTVYNEDTVTAFIVFSPVCKVNDTIQILLNNSIISSADIVNELCHGDTMGSLTVHPAGGSGNYQIQWIGSMQGTQLNDSVMTNLPAGNYTVLIQQTGYENQCFDTAVYTVTEPAILTLQPVVENITCYGAGNGIIAINTSGGSASYSYTWSHNPSVHTDSISNLLAGIYTVQVTDANGCATDTTIAISEPDSLSYTLTAQGSNCGLNDGSVSVMVYGGQAPYSYNWAGNTTYTGNEVTGMSAGQYTLEINDSNQCTITIPVIIDLLNEPVVTTTTEDVKCNGQSTGSVQAVISGGVSPYTYALETRQYTNAQTSGQPQFNNLYAGTYIFTITDANGCVVNDTVQINEPEAITLVTDSIISPTCFGDHNGRAVVSGNGGIAPYTYTWLYDQHTGNMAANLNAGEYALSITDSNNCVMQTTVTIRQPEKLQSRITVQKPLLCYGDTTAVLSADVLGGVPQYTYLWNNGQPSGASCMTGAGYIEVIVSDQYGCLDTATYHLAEPRAISITTDQVVPGKCGYAEGLADISVIGGTGYYTYSWDDGFTGEDATQLLQGTHTVSVTDENGCLALHTVEITCIDQLSIPELVTPNGDGYSDAWKIHDLTRLYPNNKVTIINRWGNVIYNEAPYNDSFTGYANTGNTLGSGLLPSGTYFYIIDLGEGNDQYTGYLEIQY